MTSIPERDFKPDRDGKLGRPLKKLFGPGHNRLNVKGCFQSKMMSKGRTTEQQVYVVAGLTQPLLGLPAIVAMGLVHRVEEVTTTKRQETTVQTAANFKSTYPAVFKGLGKLKEPYHIELEQGQYVTARQATSTGNVKTTARPWNCAQ